MDYNQVERIAMKIAEHARIAAGVEPETENILSEFFPDTKAEHEAAIRRLAETIVRMG